MLGQIEGHESEKGRLTISRGFTFPEGHSGGHGCVCVYVFKDLCIFLYDYVTAVMHV